MLKIRFDEDVFEGVSADFDLRKPNKEALRALLETIEDGYDPSVMQVMNLATGVGKTYLMAAFVEYLRRKGIYNVLIVTPGKTVQEKTVANFRQGSTKYIPGSVVPPAIVTPYDYSEFGDYQNGVLKLAIGGQQPSMAFIFNIQQLIAPKEVEGETRGNKVEAARRRPRRFDEKVGVLFDYLRGLDDLVVIADESHLYSESAQTFSNALKEVSPALTVGLTASATTADHVIYKYPLYKAIQDKFVKAPVLAFRRDGYADDIESEEQQLRDALSLLRTKQQYYDRYAATQNIPAVNAVLFVVCSDVDHATQVSNLLRTGEYFGDPLKVLQVDNKHDDEVTNRLLANLDQPYSPVRAVVSVNKLKEGWDVKNIAVVVTLRAMASEVLTQQTMGRGLRLPFGKYTAISQIDQLDIISHRSFKELLAQENVLVEFGLEDAAPLEKIDEVKHALIESASPLPVELAAKSTITPNDANTVPVEHRLEPRQVRNEESDTAATPVAADAETTAYRPPVQFRVISKDEAGSIAPAEPSFLSDLSAPRNAKFKDIHYFFPCTRVEERQAEMDLAKVQKPDIIAAAVRVTDSGERLERKEIIAELGKKLSTRDTEYTEVDSLPVEPSLVADTLVKLVMNNPLVLATDRNMKLAREHVVKTFMNNVNIPRWTVKSLDSADRELGQLIKEYADTLIRSQVSTTVVVPKRLPSQSALPVPIGDSLHDLLQEGEKFKAGRFYGPWAKSLFEYDSFDSYSGEYQLARMLETSPQIVWWHRLHRQDGAFIYFNSKDRYFPDFVAKDSDGVLWIIEGKDARGHTDKIVQAKKAAAEEVLIQLIAEEDFEDQRWGYLIAYEDDLKNSETWKDLQAKAKPIINAD